MALGAGDPQHEHHHIDEPRWVPRIAIEAAHADQLIEHGGLQGVRDRNALEAALARPRQRWCYGSYVDLATPAAAYAYGIATTHPSVGGNRGTAHIAAEAFLNVERVRCVVVG